MTSSPDLKDWATGVKRRKKENLGPLNHKPASFCRYSVLPSTGSSELLPQQSAFHSVFFSNIRQTLSISSTYLPPGVRFTLIFGISDKLLQGSRLSLFAAVSSPLEPCQLHRAPTDRRPTSPRQAASTSPTCDRHRKDRDIQHTTSSAV